LRIYRDDRPREAITRPSECGGEPLPQLKRCTWDPRWEVEHGDGEAARTLLDMTRDDALKINNSTPVKVQKMDALMDALMAFLMLIVDFLTYSGDVVRESLNMFDARIHGMITNWIGSRGLYIPFFRMSWREGGFGLAPLR
jgi:hypothetical protein